MMGKINFLREFSIPLLAGAVMAMIWANFDPSGYASFISAPLVGKLSFHTLSNDLFMALFFGIATVEIVQSCLPGGDLNPVSRAVNPLLGTLGGVLGPIAVYVGLNALIGSAELSRGWGIPTATDIALAWLAARFAFGTNHPATSYLLLLAVADDAIGLAIIAIFYPNPLMPVEPAWLLLTASGMGVAYLMRRLRFRSYWPYILGGGALSWTGLHNAHLHPALALVCIIPFLPHPRKEHAHFFEDDPDDHSTLAAFEHEWKIVVDFGLFVFGLANAGVEIGTTGTVTWLVIFSLIVGKTCGIFCFGRIAARMGYPLPRGMNGYDLLTVGMIAGTGFTVALFVAGEAFTDPVVLGNAKMGAMLSIVAALVGYAFSRFFSGKRPDSRTGS
jgi:NhaA family Na+:H+ antiporter